MFGKCSLDLGAQLVSTLPRDTVSSVGLVRGKNLPGTDSVHEHACYVRHAIALDERRVKFLPEYVDRKLRIDGHCSRPQVKEVWFAGCHSDV